MFGRLESSYLDKRIWVCSTLGKLKGKEIWQRQNLSALSETLFFFHRKVHRKKSVRTFQEHPVYFKKTLYIS